MEIKTLAEVQDGRVSVRVQESEVFTDRRVQVVISLPSASAYDPDAAAEVLAGNYGRARQEIERLEAKVRELENTVQEYDRDRHTERDRADGLKASLARTVAEANDRERNQADEIGRRFTAEQVEMAKADARASEGARIRSEIGDLAQIRQHNVTRDLKLAREELGKRFTAAQVEQVKQSALQAGEAHIRSQVRGLLNQPGVEQAMNEEQDQTLARVIRQVRELLDN
jgi:hypothetical protein